ncbi:hypothetical protein VTI74DRAFT_8911 [Chaetomium olivicolor]
MSATPVDDSTRRDHASMEEGVDSNANKGPSPAEEGFPTEKLACQRCRRRKIKCDKVHPCSHCIKARSECFVYESRMEHISKKIDDLTEMMTRLSHGQLGGADALPQPASDSRPAGLRCEALSRAAATARPPTKRSDLSLPEQEAIDSPLFVHAVMATKFLQDTVDADPSVSNVATGMKDVLDTLRSVLDSQKRQSDAYEQSDPFAKPLPLGTSMSNLPIPPLAKIMACLRVAQEHQRALLFWPQEVSSLGNFTKYVIKVCSPGPVTDADLIIVHTGLHWLFSECSSIMVEDEAKQDFQVQALICMQSLETVLSCLSFHVPMTIDYVYAMYMATLYCLHRSKPFVAWNFISKASLMPRAWSRSVSWIDAASLYGRLYDDMFSPSALALPLPTRVGRAKALASDWKQIIAKRAEYYKQAEREACGDVEPVLFRFLKHADRHRPNVFEGQYSNDFGMELDPLGAQLGSWFQESNEMMNFLLDG